jgi:6-phosphogluconate dehydrogenase
VTLAELARIWRGGCIIRARLLDPITAAFHRDPTLSTLLLDDALASQVRVRAVTPPSSERYFPTHGQQSAAQGSPTNCLSTLTLPFKFV